MSDEMEMGMEINNEKRNRNNRSTQYTYSDEYHHQREIKWVPEVILIQAIHYRYQDLRIHRVLKQSGIRGRWN